MTRGLQQRSRTTIAEVTDAAHQLFGATGFTGIGIDDVAHACGRTKGAIYHHFPTKEALFEEVFRIEQRRIADLVADATTSTDPLTALTDGTATYIHEIANNPGAARITLLDAPTVLGFEKWRHCDEGPFRTMLHHSVAAAIDTGHGHGPGTDLDALTDTLLGAVTEHALVIATSPHPPALAEPRARACAMLIRALLDPAEPT